jgi:hypothetical protein
MNIKQDTIDERFVELLLGVYWENAQKEDTKIGWFTVVAYLDGILTTLKRDFLFKPDAKTGMPRQDIIDNLTLLLGIAARQCIEKDREMF